MDNTVCELRPHTTAQCWLNHKGYREILRWNDAHAQLIVNLPRFELNGFAMCTSRNIILCWTFKRGWTFHQIKPLITDSTSVNFEKLQITAGVFFLQQVRLDESNILEADVHHLSSDLSHHEFEPTAPTPAARMTSPLSAHIQAIELLHGLCTCDQMQCSYQSNSKRLWKKTRQLAAPSVYKEIIRSVKGLFSKIKNLALGLPLFTTQPPHEGASRGHVQLRYGPPGGHVAPRGGIWKRLNNYIKIHVTKLNKGPFTLWTMKLSQGLVKFVIGCWTHPTVPSVHTKTKMSEWPWSSRPPKRHILRPALSSDMVQQVWRWERQKRCSNKKNPRAPGKELMLW
jgi:hypothetical protein